MQDISSNLFDWHNDPFSDQTFISGDADRSALGWPALLAAPLLVGHAWPIHFTITGTKGVCVMELQPPGKLNDICGMQTYVGYYVRVRIIVYISND
jgi:hypothetical protein